MKMRRFRVVVFGIVLLFMLVAPLVFGGDRWRKPIVIGWTPPDITGVFKTATNFFELAAKDGNAHGFNITVISQSPATHIAFSDQVAIIEDYIQRGVDVIAVSPIDVEAFKPAIVEANEKGVPVIIVNMVEPIPGIEAATYIGFDNTQGAEVSAYAVLDYFGGPGPLGTGRKINVPLDQYLDLAFWEKLYKNLSPAEKAKIKGTGAIIEGIAGGWASAARLDGFHKVIDQYPGIKIVGKPIAADWNREKGIKATEDILQANPSGLDFIWAASNEMGLGAMLTCESAGRLQTASEPHVLGGKKVAIFTNDVTPESVARIGEGKLMAETTHGFADWGWFGTEFAVKIACGIDIPKTYDIRPRTAYIKNATLFYPNPALPPIDWEGIKKKSK